MTGYKASGTKKWYGGITLFKVTIESKRKKLLRDGDVLILLRSAHTSGAMGESYETWIKSMK